MLSFGPFPAQVNIGYVHYDRVSGGWFRYVGGRVDDPLNWLLIGGELNEHPDITGWGQKQQGSVWYLKTDKLLYGWNGSEIVVVGGQSGEGSVEAFVFYPSLIGKKPGVFQSWNDLYNAYLNSKAGIRDIVFVEDSTIPSGLYVFDGATRFMTPGYNVVLTLSEGVIIRDLQFIEKVALVGNSVSSQQLLFSSSVVELTIEGGTIAGINVPVLLLENVPFFDIFLKDNGIIAANGLKLVSSTVGVTLFDSSCSITGNQDGDASSSIFVTRYNEDNVVDITGFGGSLSINFPGNAQRVGTTAQRPTNGVPQGHMYFDIDLNKPIWRSGAGWVDSTGTPA